MPYIPGAARTAEAIAIGVALFAFDVRIAAEVRMTQLKVSENLREFHSMFPSVAGTLRAESHTAR